jgi:hypothetical protein
MKVLAKSLVSDTILCAQSCLLSGGILQLAETAISGYCASDAEKVITTVTTIVTKYQVSLQFKSPYKLADVNQCVQTRIQKALSYCANVSVSQVSLEYTKITSRSLASKQILRSLAIQEMAQSNSSDKEFLIQNVVEMVLADVKIVNLENDAAAKSVASRLTEQVINQQLALLDLASVIVSSPAQVLSIAVTSVTTSVQGPPTSSDSSSASGGCFPSQSTVITGGGKVKRMDELRVGDNVMTSRGYRRVLYFGHADPSASVLVWSVRTDTSMTVLATALHDIILRDDRAVTNVASLVPGDRVWSLGNASGKLVESSVTAVHRSLERGVFSPHTETYDIVVDGVLMSCGTADWRGTPAFAVRVLLWSVSLLPYSLSTGTPSRKVRVRVRAVHASLSSSLSATPALPSVK